MKLSKKLIEVALPLEAINAASAREKSIRHGHPSTLHLWWARRPLAAARAVIFSQMVDDPSAHPDRFPSAEAQEAERQRLFRIIEELVKWENTTDEKVLQQARDEIWRSWRYTCAANAGDPRAQELFDPDRLPAFHDPFAGGGALPLEAQRLGLEAYASDLNPVAVLINKAMIEIPPKFAGRPPVNPEAQGEKRLVAQEWRGAQGLAEDVRYYGQWMRDNAERRIGHLYPTVEVTAEMAAERPDLRPYAGKRLTVIAWLWARTVKSPNPVFSHVDVPLVSTFMLSTKAGKEAYVEPVIEGEGYRFKVKAGKPRHAQAAKAGTSAGKRAAFRCIMSDTPVSYDYIRSEGMAGRMGVRLMAIVAEGERGRVYLAPTAEHEAVAQQIQSEWRPEVRLEGKCRVNVSIYGLDNFGDLFTPRQLVALTTFSDLVQEARAQVQADAVAAGLADDGTPLREGGAGATAYADAVAVYLGFAIDRMAMTGNSLVRWNAVGEKAQHCFGRQALPMLWDFAEPNFLATATGSVDAAIFYSSDPLNWMQPPASGSGRQEDAATQHSSIDKIVSTDPPYYDNVGYGDLSDFFYVWLRHSLRPVYPDLFATLAVPKAEELVATPYRHGSKIEAEAFFLRGMTQAMQRLAEQAHPAFPVTIYYAFKQAENKNDGSASSTGWETFLDALMRAGFAVTGTWPIRTEMRTRQIAMGTNALASSIVLVCRPRAADAPTTSRREFVNDLRSEMPAALAHMQSGNVAPVDLAQASIGPGMAVYSRYKQVLEPNGEPLTVRTALQIINQELDAYLAEQEGDLDRDTRFAVSWFEQSGFDSGEFGVADVLARAKNTSVDGVVQAGLAVSGRGKVRLRSWRDTDWDMEWNPQGDRRATVWEATHHLIKRLQAGGESGAARLLARMTSDLAGEARQLAYRLYSICERKNWAEYALEYNKLVVSWPQIQEQAAGIRQELASGGPTEQASLFE